MGKTSDDGGRSLATHAAKANISTSIFTLPLPFNVAMKKVSPLDLLCRAGALMALAQSQRKSFTDVTRMIYSRTRRPGQFWSGKQKQPVHRP